MACLVAGWQHLLSGNDLAHTYTPTVFKRVGPASLASAQGKRYHERSTEITHHGNSNPPNSIYYHPAVADRSRPPMET